MLLRLMVLALTLANLGYYAWTEGWLDSLVSVRSTGDREPQRLEQQVKPEAVRLSKAASGVVAASSQPVSVAAAAPSSAPPPAPAASCIESGPYRKEEVGLAEAAFRSVLPPGGWVNVPSERPGVWMLFMGRFIDDEARGRKEGELKRRNTAYEKIDAPPEFARGLSLGRFDSRAKAEAAQVELNRIGVRTARVVLFTPPLAQHTLRVEKAEAAVSSKLKALNLPVEIQACASP